MGFNRLRISGLASGMDTEQIVKDLMRAHQVRADRLEQNKQILNWRQETYNELNKTFANFILDTKKDFGLNFTSSTGVILNKSVSSLDWVKKAVSSDTSVADVTGRADAAAGSYDVNVTALAKNFNTASAESIGELASLKQQFALAGEDVIKFTIKHKNDQDGSRAYTFEYKGSDLTNKTVQDLVKDINSKSSEYGLGVRAIYDRSINRFFLQTAEAGENNGFSLTEEQGAVNFFTGTESKLKLNLTNGAVNQGSNAKLSFAGAQNIELESNNFTINGLVFSLKKEGSFTVNVATDVNSVYEKISKFVDKYNEMMDKIGGKLGEKQYKDYLPLTKEQREAMSEKEIELWEDKAKSGLVRNDLTLELTLSSARTGMYQNVQGITGIYQHLTQIGITTESYTSGSRGGKLVIEQDNKLKKAIADDVDSVLEFFFKEPDEQLRTKPEREMSPAELNQKRSETGLIGRLYDNLIVGMKEVIVKAGPGNDADLYRNINSMMLVDFVAEHSSISMLDEETTKLSRRIDDMNDYLYRLEDKYWRQFTAMEKAIQQMNQQSNWLVQQFMQY